MKPKSNANSGNNKLAVDKYTFGTDKKGPRILFFGAIHGDEPCGTKALKMLVAQFLAGDLKVLEGSVTIVPVCNPKAFKRGVRYCDENLNRVFRFHPNPVMYEAGIANKLVQKVLRLEQVYFADSTQDVLVKKWKNFEPVSRGRVIGRREGRAVVSAPYDGYVVMPKQNPETGDEWFYIARVE